MSIQELSSHLAASDGRGELEQDASGRLLFTEEQCVRMSQAVHMATARQGWKQTT
jgi:hypothetical protein